MKLVGASSVGAAASLLMRPFTGVGDPVRFLFGGNNVRIGVLLPTSATHPQMGDNLLAGMRAYFDTGSPMNPVFVSEQVPGGYLGATGKALKLVEQDRVDIVVAGVSSQVAPRLRDVFEPRQVPFIVSNTGVTPISSSDLGNFGIHNSLGHWQSSWATGAWAGANAGKDGLIVTTLADSGNSSIYSFKLGLDSSGGRVVDTVIADEQSVLNRISETKPDFVYAMMSGSAGSSFLREYDGQNLPPLFVSGLMTERFVLSEGASSSGLVNSSSWSDALNTKENSTFAKAFTQESGRKPDPFGAIGFETAQLIDESVRSIGGSAGNAQNVIDALLSATITGPRGNVSIDPATRSSTVPMYLREARASGTSWQNSIMGELPRVSLADASDAGLMAATTSGLLNEFLCCEV